ncbi:NAD(+) diphosphatase [Leucobacter rhizosphaerae]|uniref:NAD(+) diphosphatase n=1 Tax=Leucobacter rhizosphaerae TaxID=2932245 RepID=A0ABY4FWL6_9MICO|nr:NAD(+) diphosphatase [Leucobacter rhizosphaerae]UOQ60631.1 NAD(+) diphosphatase [Leucobacter rhizosphaerae]
MSQPHPPFAAGILDRDATTRQDPELLESAWAEPGARLFRLRGVEIPVTTDDAGTTRLALLPTDGALALQGEGAAVGHVYVGRMSGAPVFAMLVEEESAAHDDTVTWRHPFEVGSGLTDLECEIVAVASALLRWHEAAEYSPRDGEPTAPELGGWGRREARGGELFPRTDPAVIVLIEHDDRVLLGSNALWETGRFSLLAGFVEAGESLEQTVRREIFEEAGVHLGEIGYVASQPWPFPRSLMVGFRARLADGADPDDLSPDIEEISELRWFTRDEIRNPAPDLRLPMPMSIARWMIDTWVNEGDDRGRRH